MKFKLIPVVSIQTKKFNGRVYDLSVDKVHSYNIKGIAVHNSMCSTRLVTGHGMPQALAIVDCARIKAKFPGVHLIADGGIRNSGDIAKALALGANSVMIGGLFAGTIESPGEILNGRKVYRGMASREARVDFDPNLPVDYTPEGVSSMKPLTGPVSLIVNNLVGGVRSALSYSGQNNIGSFQKAAKFMLITGSSNTEGTPHGLKV